MIRETTPEQRRFRAQLDPDQRVHYDLVRNQRHKQVFRIILLGFAVAGFLLFWALDERAKEFNARQGNVVNPCPVTVAGDSGAPLPTSCPKSGERDLRPVGWRRDMDDMSRPSG